MMDTTALLHACVPAGQGVSDLIYSSFLGGTGYDETLGTLALGAAGRVYVTGETTFL